MKQIMKQFLVAVLTLITAISFAQEGTVKLVTIDGKYAVNSEGKLLKVSAPEDYFSYTVDNRYGRNLSPNFKVNTKADSTFTMKVDWGDGTVNNYTAATLINPTHTYTAGDVYEVKLYVDNPYKTLYVEISDYDNNNVTLFRNVEYFKRLFRFAVSANVLRTDSLQNIKLNLTGNAAEQYLDFGYNGLTKFTPTNGIPSNVVELRLNANALNQTEINNTLVWLDGQTFNAGTKYLYIKQATPAAPSGAGITAITSLEGKGWVIDHD